MFLSRQVRLHQHHEDENICYGEHAVWSQQEGGLARCVHSVHHLYFAPSPETDPALATELQAFMQQEDIPNWYVLRT